MARTIIKSNSTDRTKRQRLAHDQNINTKMPKPSSASPSSTKKAAPKSAPKPGGKRSDAPGNSRAGTEKSKSSVNGSMQMAPPKKEVKKAVKKTATAAKKTVKRAVAAVKKVVKKSAKAGGGRAAEAGRKAWYT